MPHKTRVIWNRIKTTSVVVVITFLIWFAADQKPKRFSPVSLITCFSLRSWV